MQRKTCAHHGALINPSHMNTLVQPNGRLYTQRSLAYNLLTAIPTVTVLNRK